MRNCMPCLVLFRCAMTTLTAALLLLTATTAAPQPVTTEPPCHPAATVDTRSLTVARFLIGKLSTAAVLLRDASPYVRGHDLHLSQAIGEEIKDMEGTITLLKEEIREICKGRESPPNATKRAPPLLDEERA